MEIAKWLLPLNNTRRPVPPRRFQRRLEALATLIVVMAVITFAMACLYPDVSGGAAREDIVEETPLRIGTTTAVVPEVNSEGFHARRRAMAGTASRRGRAFPEEPAGFVFEEASLEGENSPRASALFAAARESAVVLDGAADVKDAVSRRAQSGACGFANATSEIRARVAELVRKSAAQPSASSAATGCSSESFGAPADRVVGDETIGPLCLRTGRGEEAEMRGESGAARERCGDVDAEQGGGAAEGASPPFTAATTGQLETGAWRACMETSSCGVSRGEDAPEDPERVVPGCGTDGKGEDAGTTGSGRMEEEAGGGTDEDRPRIAQEGSHESRQTGGTAEEPAVVFALTGWNVDEVESLLEAYPRTPWLYLYRDHDDSSNPCLQNRSAIAATRLLSRPAASSEGVMLPSSRLTAAAAARALKRLFGVALSPAGELLMAELYARHASAADGPSLSLGVAPERAVWAGAPRNSSLEDRARPPEEPCLELREASAISAKVLGGPFDRTWWWGSGGTAEMIFGNGRAEEQAGASNLDHAADGAPACGGSSTGVLAADVDAGSFSDAVVALERGCLCRGAAAAAGGDGGKNESGGAQDEMLEGEVVGSLPAAAPAAAAAAASAVTAAEAGPAATQAGQRRDPLELGAAASLGGGEMDRARAERQWQWQRGLRRMVDSDSPAWMSSEVYSEPLERFICPDVPGPDYPSEWPLLDLLGNWNPGNASAVPPRHFLGVCRFDYQTELHKARAYGLREVPFVVYNVPELDRAVQEWSNPVKLAAALENHLYSIDVSSTNRFLYYGKRSLDRPPGWTPPTWRISDTFGSWLQHALGDQSDGHMDRSGMTSDRPVGLPSEESPQQLHGDRNGERSGAGVGREGPGEAAAGAEAPQSKLHYYLKLSSSREEPNRFVDRSLPFFVPPASSRREIVDENGDVRPADGNYYTAGKQDRRRKKSTKKRWADKVRREGNRQASSEERVGGDAATTTRGVGDVKQQHDKEDEEKEFEEAGGGDDIDVFLRDASATRGIHCRLGMDGVMSDGHYDGSRNVVALLAGKRRWILSSPKNCAHMHMFRKGHPSARHTSADWTDPDVVEQSPNLGKATANEVILRAGEALYVPEHWIHSIVNIGVSAQCNSRSGKTQLYQPIVQECEASAHAE